MFYSNSPGRTRTADPVINSHLLYRLSYRGKSRERYFTHENPYGQALIEHFLLSNARINSLRETAAKNVR